MGNALSASHMHEAILHEFPRSQMTAVILMKISSLATSTTCARYRFA